MGRKKLAPFEQTVLAAVAALERMPVASRFWRFVEWPKRFLRYSKRSTAAALF